MKKRNLRRERDIIEVFAERLRHVRLGQHLSQEELGVLAGLDRTYISGLERGVRNPTLKTIDRIADALGVAPTVLLS